MPEVGYGIGVQGGQHVAGGNKVADGHVDGADFSGQLEGQIGPGGEYQLAAYAKVADRAVDFRGCGVWSASGFGRVRAIGAGAAADKQHRRQNSQRQRSGTDARNQA